MEKADLLNMSLTFLGEDPITNPDAPETPSGRTLARLYDETRRQTLRRYCWNFSETWAVINQTTAPAFGYTDAYAFPQDCLRLLLVMDPTAPECDIRDYRILNQGAPEYRKVIALCNNGLPTLNIAYNADIKNLSQWDPLAIKVFAYWLAMDSAKGVTGQDALVASLNGLMTEEIKDAVGVDGQEQSIRLYQFSPTKDARRMAQYGAGFFTPVQGY